MGPKNTGLEPELNVYRDISKMAVSSHKLIHPLITAAAEGFLTAVTIMCRYVTDVNVQDDSGYTPLFAASRHGHGHVVRTLCELGADVHKAGVGNCSALYVAAQRGHVDVVRILCEKGADLNTEAGDCGHTPLTVALQQGHSDVVEVLCANGADVNKPAYGRTPILLAVELGMKEMVSTLCRHGADGRQMDISGYTPLNMAVQSGNTDMVRFLCEIGANVNEPEQWQSPMASAAELGDVEMLKLLCAYGADVNEEDVLGCGHTPLSIAAKEGHVEVVGFLIGQGADVDMTLSSNLYHSRVWGRNAIECAISGLNDTADNFAVFPKDEVLSLASNYFQVLHILIRATRSTNSPALALLLKAAETLFQNFDCDRVSLGEEMANCLKLLLSAGSRVDHTALEIITSDALRPVRERSEILGLFLGCARPESLQRLCKFAIRGSIHRPLPVSVMQTGLPTILQKYLLLNLLD